MDRGQGDQQRLAERNLEAAGRRRGGEPQAVHPARGEGPNALLQPL